MAESSHFDGETPISVLSVGPDDYRFADPVKWSVDVTNTGSALLVTGIATATGSCTCARCLDEVVINFQGEIENYLLLDGADVQDFDEDEDAPGDDEFEVLPADHILDLEPMIRSALILDAPYQPLCSDECKGLCPNCGANLNDGCCTCGGDAALEDFNKQANPFSALANYTFDD